MTPDIANYADYYLRRLVNSLEKPYDPDRGGESALARLTSKLVGDAAGAGRGRARELREAQPRRGDAGPLHPRARRRHRRQPQVRRPGARHQYRARAALPAARRPAHRPARAPVPLRPPAHRPLAPVGRRARSQHRRGPRLRDHRRARQADVDGRSRRARVLHRPGGGPALLRRSPRSASRRPCATSSRSPTACPTPSSSSRAWRTSTARCAAFSPSPTSIASRSRAPSRCWKAARRGGTPHHRQAPRARGRSQWRRELSRPVAVLRHAVLRGVRRSVDAPPAGARAEPPARQDSSRRSRRSPKRRTTSRGFISTLAAALGFGLATRRPTTAAIGHRASTTASMWSRFQNASEAEMPSDERELLDILAAALGARQGRVGRRRHLRRSSASKSPTICPRSTSPSSTSRASRSETRVFLCNRPTQGGGLKRQLDKVLATMGGKPCFMLRAQRLPAQPARTRRRRPSASSARRGGRQIMVPHPRLGAHDDGARVPRPPSPRSGLRRLVRGRQAAFEPVADRAASAPRPASAAARCRRPASRVDADGMQTPCCRRARRARDSRRQAPRTWTQWTGDAAAGSAMPRPPTTTSCRCPSSSTRPAPTATSIVAGRQTGGARASPSRSTRNVLKRHAAVLGGSGSGKTTLALCLIEQLLLRASPPCSSTARATSAATPTPTSGAPTTTSSPSAAASARSSPTPSTSPSTRRAAPPAGRSPSRCCRPASTSCPSTSSSCWPTCRRPRSATCCI